MINYIVGEKGKRGPFVGFPVVSACHRPSLVAVALAGGREMPCLALAGIGASIFALRPTISVT